MTTRPSWPQRRSISAAALPAAPAPTITTVRGAAARSTCAGYVGDERFAIDLVRDDDLRAAPLDLEARHRRERGSLERLASAQTEARVMPRAANGVAVDQTLGERAAVVRARRADGEVLVANTGEQHALAIRVSEQLAARLQRRRVDSLSEIGTCELRLITHGLPSSVAVVQFIRRVRGDPINFARTPTTNFRRRARRDPKTSAIPSESFSVRSRSPTRNVPPPSTPSPRCRRNCAPPCAG